MDRLAFLADLAKQDERLVDGNQSYGDELEKARTLQFILLGDAEQQAEAVCAVITSCCHCRAFVSDDPGWSNAEELPGWRVVVWVDIPCTKSVLGSFSALMAVFALEAGMRYSGWSGPLLTSYPMEIMPQVIDQGWRALTAAERHDSQGQVQRALSPEHALAGVELRAMFGRQDCDDVVCELPDKRVARIYLTRSGELGPDDPQVMAYDSLQEWLDADRLDRSDGPPN